MIRSLLLVLAGTPVAAQETVEVPSGQPMELVEVLRDPHGTNGMSYRFRFVAPRIAPGGSIDFDTTIADLAHLCETLALPRIAGTVPPPRQVVLSVSDRPVEFGDPAPEATQFFEAYSIEDGACIPELF